MELCKTPSQANSGRDRIHNSYHMPLCIVIYSFIFQPINNVPYEQKPTELPLNTVLPPTPSPDLALGRAPDHAPTDQPISVLLLGYQRTGSSFLGQLFNKYPKNYYVFEPVDGIYSALYGIKPGWALASDIVRHWNGTKRLVMPQVVLFS